MKSLTTTKRFPKKEREKKILFGLVKLYIQSGKPIGSNTLKEDGFGDLSSATIRNYFAKLEKEGYLQQQHSSGGRLPTEKAFREYAQEHLDSNIVDEQIDNHLNRLLKKETKEISDYLHFACDMLSDLIHCPILLSLPKLDMDFIQAIKLFSIQKNKVLCLLITDFGLIRTEIFYTPQLFTHDELQLVEDYFYWRLNKREKPFIDNEALTKWGQRLYNEIIVRHFIANSGQPVKHMGISKLLSYPEFHDSSALAEGLTFFENQRDIDFLFDSCLKNNDLSFWMGQELKGNNLSLIALPYSIGPTPVGVIAILGPIRLPFPKLFGILRVFNQYLSETLTQNAYKFKISFRAKEDRTPSILLENKGSTI